MALPVVLTGALIGLGVVLWGESKSKAKHTAGVLPGEGVEGNIGGERESETGLIKSTDSTGQSVTMEPTDVGPRPVPQEDKPQPTPTGFPDMETVTSEEDQAGPSMQAYTELVDEEGRLVGIDRRTGPLTVQGEPIPPPTTVPAGERTGPRAGGGYTSAYQPRVPRISPDTSNLDRAIGNKNNPKGRKSPMPIVTPIYNQSTKGMTKARAGAVLSASRKVIF